LRIVVPPLVTGVLSRTVSCTSCPAGKAIGAQALAAATSCRAAGKEEENKEDSNDDDSKQDPTAPCVPRALVTAIIAIVVIRSVVGAVVTVLTSN